MLGSESYIKNTWMWIWANEQISVNPNLLKSVNKIKEYGKKYNINELSEGIVDLNKIDGHLLSLIVLEILNENCYYKGTYEGGAVFFIVKGVS